MFEVKVKDDMYSQKMQYNKTVVIMFSMFDAILISYLTLLSS